MWEWVETDWRFGATALREEDHAPVMTAPMSVFESVATGAKCPSGAARFRSKTVPRRIVGAETTSPWWQYRGIAALQSRVLAIVQWIERVPPKC